MLCWCNHHEFWIAVQPTTHRRIKATKTQWIIDAEKLMIELQREPCWSMNKTWEQQEAKYIFATEETGRAPSALI